MLVRISKRRCRVAICVLALVALAAGPASFAAAEAAPPKPVGEALEQLADVLGRLEAELAELEAPAAERLEEGLERIVESIEELLVELDAPQDEADADVRARIIRLDLALHRLLYALDEMLENTPKTPARPQARAALDDLQEWVDAYIDGTTADMPARQAATFERAARDMVRSLSQQLANMARRAQQPERPALGRLVERFEELLFRLDGLILHRLQESSGQ